MRYIYGIIGLVLIALIVMGSVVSAMTFTSVSVDELSPGREGIIRIEIENTLNERVEDVTLNLNFQGLPFIPAGSSSDSTDELDEDEEEQFNFRIRASADVAPGDYQIPYTLTYIQDDVLKTRTGSIGVSIKAQPELSYSIDTETPVIGRQGKINLKIVNKGLADARFVSVSVNRLPGLTILSEKEVYIGTIDSDDFETASFDVIFIREKPRLEGKIEYIDFDNKKKLEEFIIPIKVYTEEEALELGIIERNNWPLYIGIIVALIVLWFVWRTIQKRRRMKKSIGG